jgi:hypothetical protein
MKDEIVLYHPNSTTELFSVVKKEEDRNVSRKIRLYNLDVIISVVYRVKSKQGTQFSQSHDRFLIIDSKEVYHLGATLKDLGKKWFAFSRLEPKSVGVLNAIMKLI